MKTSQDIKTTKDEYLADLRYVLQMNKEGKPVELDSIPRIFRDDLNHFIMGETLQAINGKIVISPKRYRDWVNKVMNTGLDYVIYLENS